MSGAISTLYRALKREVVNFSTPPSDLEITATNTFIQTGKDHFRFIAALSAIAPIAASSIMIVGHPVRALRNSAVAVLHLQFGKAVCELAAGGFYPLRSLYNIAHVFSTAFFGALLVPYLNGIMFKHRKLYNSTLVDLTTREQQEAEKLKQLEKEIADKQAVLSDASGFVKARLTGVEQQFDGLALRIAGQLDGHTVVTLSQDNKEVERLTRDLTTTQSQLLETEQAKIALAREYEGKISVLEEKYKHELQEAKEAQQTELQATSARLNKEHEEACAQLTAHHQRQLDALRSNANTPVSSARNPIDTSKLKQTIRGLQDENGQLQEKLSALNSTKDRLSCEFEAVRSELAGVKEEQLRLIAEHEAALAVLQGKHAAALQEAQTFHEQRLASFEDRRREQLEELSQAHKATEARHTEKMSHLEAGQAGFNQTT